MIRKTSTSGCTIFYWTLCNPGWHQKICLHKRFLYPFWKKKLYTKRIWFQVMILLNLHCTCWIFFLNLKSYSMNKWHNYNYVIKPITFPKVTYLHSFLFAALKNDSIKRKPTIVQVSTWGKSKKVFTCTIKSKSFNAEICKHASGTVTY